jgi:hypothetical protein
MADDPSTRDLEPPKTPWIVKLAEGAMDSLQILREAIKAVPSVKYALGVAGILAAASIAMTLSKNDWRFALIGTICTILLMVIMVVFARLSTTAAANLRGPVLVLTWFSVILLMVWATGLTSWAFVGWPPLPFTNVRAFSDASTSACTLAPSSSTEIVREATAGEILTLMKPVASWKRQAQFKQLYEKNISLEVDGLAPSKAFQTLRMVYANSWSWRTRRERACKLTPV